MKVDAPDLSRFVTGFPCACCVLCVLAVCVISKLQEHDESKGGIAYAKEDRSSWYVWQRSVLRP